jgi:tRNA-2-methylthio-N6-dimethylallyladenosine synthase
MNQSDGERIASVLESMGCTATEDEAEANILGVVACSVRQKSIDRVYSKILKWNQWKSQRLLLTFVSGCVLPADHEKFLDRFDLVFGIAQLPQLPQMIARYGVSTPALAVPAAPADAAVPTGAANGSLADFWHIEPSHKSRFEAYVPIQNGCDKFCSYCAVPYTRGRELSRPSDEILAEVRDLVDRGYRSITLLGQNVNSYGLDKQSRQAGGELDFGQLLAAIGAYGDRVRRERGQDFWVYFTSPHPRDMKPGLLDIIAAHPCLAKQIHLPLQSGDDAVLARMNRQHDLARYRGIVADIRRILPAATLFTDIIVGFSGESPQEFAATRAALAEFGFNMAYIATYSPRPGAASAEWPDDIPLEEKKQRLHELTELFKSSSLAWNQALVGTEIPVLVEAADPEGRWLQARTEGRVPLRLPLPPDSDPQALVGNFIRVRVTRALPLSLAGEWLGRLP